MTSSIGDALRSVWHVMTSRDRHSSFDSPFRTGRLVPLSEIRNSLATVVIATESRTGLNEIYSDDTDRPSYCSSEHLSMPPSPYTLSSPIKSYPYAPGLRSSLAVVSTNSIISPDLDPTITAAKASGEIPMQSFQDGLPPPPPPTHSWSKIDAWAEEHYPELSDQICEGATNNDLNELELQLDCSLPQDVRDSLMIHDGQERGGAPTGIVFGSMLLDCEEIAQEWEMWRRVTSDYGLDPTTTYDPSRGPGRPAVPIRAFAVPSSSKSSPSIARPPSQRSSNNPNWRQDLMARQDCIPHGTIQQSYAHPAWVPLVRDWGGNNLAVDLAPGPAGRWGQIILFGRDYDTKYVVARSWSAFLALLADDLSSGKWYVDEDTNELKLREFKDSRVEPSYFSIMRWRMDQKHGRRAMVAKRMSANSAPRVAPYGCAF